MTDAETDPHGRRGLPALPKTIKVRNRVYRVLEEVGGAGRKRYWVRDRPAGPRGDYRQILVLPRGEASSQHLATLQRLSHGNPNLPTILDSETRGDEIFVVTNWVRGPDLQTYLDDARSKDCQRLTPTEVMKLYRGLAHGLSQMHKHRGVRHGDIKPANLIVAREPNRLVMIDFGSAWMTERTTRRDPGDGTSHGYTAPERLDDPQRPDNAVSVVDARSDQFSTTVVAYEMLTGVLPYGEMGGKAGLLENRPIYEPLYRPPSQLSPVRRQIPGRIWRLIDKVIARGLKLDAKERFPSRDPWLDALEDVHCETRRKAQFGRVQTMALRLIGRFGDRLYRSDVP